MKNLAARLINYCNKQKKVAKSFIGWARFTDGITNLYPGKIDKEQEKRILMYLYWEYRSKITTILEEKLVYSPKDLLAWLGGALGIFVGYSFFDLMKHFIDIAFYFIYKVIRKR